MVDPCAAPFTAMPRSATQLLHLARHNWVLAFDHVSHITPSISDTLCRITSGVGLAWREPGRRDPVQQWIKRPILLTITDTCELPPDIAARALFVTLPDLIAETRRPESDVLAVIKEAFPHIFDALCAAISRALANLRPIPSASRHAGALAWITAAFPGLAADLAAAIEEPPPPPLFVAQIRALPPHWEGTATDLLPLTRAAQTPKGISQALNKHALALSDAGIRISFRRRHEGQRIISIDASPCLPPPPLPTPNASHPDPQPLTPDPCSVVLCHPSLESVPLK
jgi:hypothetical protein